MKQYQIANKPITTIIIAIYILCMLFLCRASMLNIAILGAFWSQVFAIGLTALLFLLTTLWNYKSRYFWQSIKKRAVLAFMFSLLFLFSMVVKRDYSLLYFTIIIIFFEVAVLSLVAGVDKFARVFVTIVAFLALYSLIVNYLLRSLVFAYWPGCMDFINTLGYHFMNLIFSNMMDLSYYFRNYGIFREPGQYAFIILIALISNLFVLKKNKYRLVISIILILSMLSTFSPTGVVSMVLLLLASIIHARKSIFGQNKILRKSIFFVVLMFTAVLCIGAYIRSDMNLRDTLTISITKVFSLSNDSSRTRAVSVYSNMKMFIGSPLVGNKSAIVINDVEDNTFTPGILLAIFGIVVTFIICLLWWNLAVSIISKNHFVIIGMVLVSIFIGVSTQNLVPELFFYILPLMAYYDKSDKAMPIIDYIKSKITKRRSI